jgi:ribosome-associated protein
MTEAAEKKDVQKLQRIIVDALEDVKAVDIAVYNTEHLSSLFERVILASGTSNRQTKALASNVRDEVRKSGHAKPRIEGEENGEWIIVDCGAAVVHIMQPNIREYYHLEEIWGDKPVRLKFGAPKPVFAKAEEPAEKKKPAKKAPSSAKKGSATKAPSRNTRGSKTPTRGLKTAVDPKTGLTTPVNNSRRAIDKRPYLAELPDPATAKPKAKAVAKSVSKSAPKPTSKTTTKPTTKPTSKSTSKPRAPSSRPASSSAPTASKKSTAKSPVAKKAASKRTPKSA